MKVPFDCTFCWYPKLTMTWALNKTSTNHDDQTDTFGSFFFSYCQSHHCGAINHIACIHTDTLWPFCRSRGHKMTCQVSVRKYLTSSGSSWVLSYRWRHLEKCFRRRRNLIGCSLEVYLTGGKSFKSKAISSSNPALLVRQDCDQVLRYCIYVCCTFFTWEKDLLGYMPS